MADLVFLGKRHSAFGFRTPKKVEPVKVPRDDQIRLLRKEGMTYQQLADEFGLSNARVQQICKK